MVGTEDSQPQANQHVIECNFIANVLHQQKMFLIMIAHCNVDTNTSNHQSALHWMCWALSFIGAADCPLHSSMTGTVVRHMFCLLDSWSTTASGFRNCRT